MLITDYMLKMGKLRFRGGRKGDLIRGSNLNLELLVRMKKIDVRTAKLEPKNFAWK